MKNIIKVSLFLLVTLFLTGCASVKLDFSATNNINQNQLGRPSSTKIYVYQLTNNYAFQNANFSDFEMGNATLNNTIISKQIFFIIPGESKTINIQHEEGARFLGVVAGFYDLKDTVWKVTQPLSNHYYRKTYDISLSKQGIKIN